MRRAPKEMTRAGLIAIVIASLALSGPAWASSNRTPATKQATVVTGKSKKAASAKTQAVKVAAVNDPVIDLCARTGSATMADGTSVPIWGFTVDAAPGVPGCGGNLARLPGPVLGIDTATITAGDQVTINLENLDVPENVSLMIHGMAPMVPAPSGGALAAPVVSPNTDSTAGQITGGSRVYAFTENTSSGMSSIGTQSVTIIQNSSHTSNNVTVPALSAGVTSYNLFRTKSPNTTPASNLDWFLVASNLAPGTFKDTKPDNTLGGNPPVVGPADTTGVAAGSSVTYQYTATNPGTFLYESGADPVNELPMGLYGALVVHSATPNQAYGNNAAFNGATTNYDKEQVLVLSEIDPVLNTAINSSASFNMLNYKPQYWLINGQSYPQTPNITAPGGAGERVLLRYVNAGVEQHTMMLMGAHESFVAFDASPLTCPLPTAAPPAPSCPLNLDSEIFPAGTTGDAIVTIPAGSTSGAKFALFSRNMDLTNGLNPDVQGNPANPNYTPGGMMVFITVP